jgi:RNA polymerase sigma-70 factor (ECF subfamily)
MDAEGFDDLFTAEYLPVARSVYLICQDWSRAQDATQEAFIQLLVHWDRVSRFDRPGAWVRRVAIRLANRSSMRDARRRGAEALVEPGAPEEAGFDVDILDALRLLSPHQRVAVVLFYFERSSLEEIGEVLGCSPSTAGVHLHRARGRLEELLTEVGSDGAR